MLDDDDLVRVVGLQKLRQHVGDLGQELFHILAKAREVLDRLLPDVNVFVLAQVEDGVQRVVSLLRELGEESRNELRGQALGLTVALDASQDDFVVLFVLRQIRN